MSLSVSERIILKGRIGQLWPLLIYEETYVRACSQFFIFFEELRVTFKLSTIGLVWLSASERTIVKMEKCSPVKRQADKKVDEKIDEKWIKKVHLLKGRWIKK